MSQLFSSDDLNELYRRIEQECLATAVFMIAGKCYRTDSDEVRGFTKKLAQLIAERVGENVNRILFRGTEGSTSVYDAYHGE
jgi:hypothetical protein